MSYTDRAIGVASRLHGQHANGNEITRRNEESPADLEQFDGAAPEPLPDAPLILTPETVEIPAECQCPKACARLGLCPRGWCGRMVSEEEAAARVLTEEPALYTRYLSETEAERATPTEPAPTLAALATRRQEIERDLRFWDLGRRAFFEETPNASEADFVAAVAEHAPGWESETTLRAELERVAAEIAAQEYVGQL